MDPGQVTAVADALPFAHTYTSGMIIWSSDERFVSKNTNELKTRDSNNL